MCLRHSSPLLLLLACGASLASAQVPVVEIAYPGFNPCFGMPPGCDEYGGNAVFHDPNVNSDYYLSVGSNGHIDGLRRFLEAAQPDDFEIRFTDAGGLGVYPLGLGPSAGGNRIASVPFELWNIGTTPDDPADDRRMIPFLVANDAPLADWANQFTGNDPWAGSPTPGGTPITDWVYGMMPDRPGGYALFEAAALSFGGAGAVYDPAADGDTQLDPDPSEPDSLCTNQGYYVDFCWRNDQLTGSIPGGTFGSQFVYTLGQVVFADLKGDGSNTTPPTGTLIRFLTTELVTTSAEPSVFEAPDGYALGAAYPNPFNPRAVVPYQLGEAGPVRLAVFDVLGREVAVLVDGLQAAGHHEASFEAAGLPSGAYLYVLEAGGARLSGTVSLVR